MESPGATAALAGAAADGWRAWRRWRHTRPFWGGLLVLAGGAEILLSEKAPLPVLVHIGMQGLAGYLIPIIMVLCGLLLLLHPAQQMFYSVLAVLLSVGSWITSNLGGFFAGMLLGVIGGSLAFAWQPRDQRARGKRRRARRLQREPSAGLALIRGDPPAAAAPGGADAGPGGADAGPGGADSGPGSAADGRGPGTGRWRTGAILAIPLVLSMLTAPLLRGFPAGAGPGPVPGAGGTPVPAASPSGTPTPNAGGTPAPTASPAPAPRPSPSASKRARHVRAAGPAAVTASVARSVLAAGTAVLSGMSFDGVADVPTAAGTVPMLKLGIGSLTLSGGVTLLVRQDGHTWTARDASLGFGGPVVLYTTKISGDRNGVPVTFTPRRPPPRHLAALTLAGAAIHRPYLTADSARASGLRITG